MVRMATQNDLNDIVNVHRVCFPKSFTTVMGKRLLYRYYAEFMGKNPELFLVLQTARENIDGFCMGYYGEDSGLTKSFIKKNRLRFALRVLWLLVIGNRAAWKRVRLCFNSKKRKNDYCQR